MAFGMDSLRMEAKLAGLLLTVYMEASTMLQILGIASLLLGGSLRR